MSINTKKLISVEEYEWLKKLEEIIEHLEIADIIETRLKNYDDSNNISWETIRNLYGL
ncbi:hypothetical protein MCHI_000919 [Candidatus Magnetoovum chiemensis]|nr:hypothetical protein MCHI_000919 [Candidatus Magnetoovum chiemensis]